ncbi:MAG: 16S rRNA (cytosine(1402)-N(4))-methyltransferase RsmH [Planctomycetaceae bacterium]|nr:16S rRNA (cytosine(1402)-N(4))-methyltransferase RsmH [Planctomycetales bacterium]MCB9923897.1 16S rRNA (cytosine(1402)-N(4))-methyltransferase RsmH [Planctomycetaceae bacterium]
MAKFDTVHVPVLPDEILEWLGPKPGSVIVDGTLGGGGHSRLLAARLEGQGQVIGIDRDPRAVQITSQLLTGLPVTCVQGSYADLREILDELGIALVDGVLLDLGLSSDQLADQERGFSFAGDGPLDLRFDPTRGEPAWRLLERLSAEHLANVIFEFGEERYSRRIARAIVEHRRGTPIRNAGQLASLVRRCVPRSRNVNLDPATRTFQALRIAVNDELSILNSVLEKLPNCVRPGGRIAIISFHSLEDRRVKVAFRQDPRYVILTKKPIRPNETEIRSNPRSRSAKLRVAERAVC